jgi:hypothetical protein
MALNNMYSSTCGAKTGNFRTTLRCTVMFTLRTRLARESELEMFTKCQKKREGWPINNRFHLTIMSQQQ